MFPFAAALGGSGAAGGGSSFFGGLGGLLGGAALGGLGSLFGGEEDRIGINRTQDRRRLNYGVPSLPFNDPNYMALIESGQISPFSGREPQRQLALGSLDNYSDFYNQTINPLARQYIEPLLAQLNPGTSGILSQLAGSTQSTLGDYDRAYQDAVTRANQAQLGIDNSINGLRRYSTQAINEQAANVQRSLEGRGLGNTGLLEQDIVANIAPGVIGQQLNAEAGLEQARANTALGSAGLLGQLASQRAGLGLQGAGNIANTGLGLATSGQNGGLLSLLLGTMSRPEDFRAQTLGQSSAIFRDPTTQAELLGRAGGAGALQQGASAGQNFGGILGNLGGQLSTLSLFDLLQ